MVRTALLRIVSLAVVVATALAVLSMLIPSPVSVKAQREVVLYTHGWWQPPPRNRFNPFAPDSIVIGGLVYERLAFWISMTNEYKPELATDWETRREENKIVVHLRKNVYWHDGTPFTCKDVWTTFTIYRALNRPVWRYISDIKCVDDYTVEFTIKEWIYLLLHYVLHTDGLIVAPYHIYGKFAERIVAGEDPQVVIKDLIEFEPESIIGTGPFRFVTITPSEVVLEKFEKYWAADKILIDKVVMPYIVSNEVGWEYYRAGKLDFDVFMMPPEVERELREKPFTMIVKIYDLSGFALVFNFGNKWLRIREVRMAIAYAIDRQKVAEAAGAGFFEPVKYPTGLLKLSENWIKDLIDAGILEKYEYNLAKAEELLKSVGFEKRGGKWYTPEGEPFKITMIAPGGWTDWVAAMTVVAEELRAFGIDVELVTPEAPSYWSDEWYLGGHYDIAIDFFGAWMVYPWAAFERMFIEVDRRPRNVVQGAEFPYKLYLPYFDEEVDVRELVEVLVRSFEEKKQREAAMKLAYAANYYLPQYPIAEKMLIIFANKEHFIWPDPNVYYLLWQNAAGRHLEALAYMIKTGSVVPNPEYWGITVTPLPITPTPTPSTVTVTVTERVTVERTVPTTVTQTVLTTIVQTEVNWGISIALLIVGLVIGLAIGFVMKRR